MTGKSCILWSGKKRNIKKDVCWKELYKTERIKETWKIIFRKTTESKQNMVRNKEETNLEKHWKRVITYCFFRKWLGCYLATI